MSEEWSEARAHAVGILSLGKLQQLEAAGYAVLPADVQQELERLRARVKDLTTALRRVYTWLYCEVSDYQDTYGDEDEGILEAALMAVLFGEKQQTAVCTCPEVW